MVRSKVQRLAVGALGALAIVVQATGCATGSPPIAGPGSEAYAVTSAGLVAGSTPGASGVAQAFVWDERAGLRRLDPAGSVATAIDATDTGLVLVNEQGQGSGPGPATLWDLTTGTKRTFPIPGWPGRSGVAVNERGQVLTSTTQQFPQPPAIRQIAMLHEPDGTEHRVLLDVRPRTPGSAPGRLNDRGQVVGRATGTAEGAKPAVWSVAEGLRLLELPAEYGDAEPLGINDQGTIVGVAWDASGRPVPVTWANPSAPLTRRPDLGGSATLVAVNDAGVAIGSVTRADGTSMPYAVRLEDGATIAGPAGAQWRDINDAGQVVGTFEGRARRWTVSP